MKEHCVHTRKTVQGCLLWADQIWPNFWKFVTKQELTKPEMLELDRYFSTQKKYLFRFRQHLRDIYIVDPSKNAVHYLMLSNHAYTRMTKRLQHIKYRNEVQLRQKYGTSTCYSLRTLIEQ